MGNPSEATKDEKKNVKKVPLDRLNELPDHFIERIVPVLFPQDEWRLVENKIVILATDNEEEKSIILSEIQYEIVELFNSKFELRQIAKAIAEKRKIGSASAYRETCSLFFRLASLRVCHPREVYDIEAIKNSYKIPLNRLHELPDNIIAQIVPVFFPQHEWKLKEHTIMIYDVDDKLSARLILNDSEFVIFRYFGKDLALKVIAEQIAAECNIAFHESYNKVTSLFFKLASMRVCHPREVYAFNKLIKQENKPEE